MPQPFRDRRAGTRVWTIALAALALVNLAFGVWMFARDPARSADLKEMTRWVTTWRAGGNPYLSTTEAVDYPPWALPLLVPLSVGGLHLWRLVWPVVDLGALAVVLLTIARAASQGSHIAWRLIVIGAAAAASHTIGQFSVLAFACAMAGAFAVGEVSGGIWLGVSLFKPHVGGVVWIWSVLEGNWKRAAIALMVPVLLLAVFAGRLGLSPMAATGMYAHALESLHDDGVPFAGHTDLAPWLAAITPMAGSFVGRMITLAVLLVPAVIVSLSRPANDVRERFERLTLCAAASLLAVRHLSYDLILLFPLLAAWSARPSGQRQDPRIRQTAFATLATLLVVPLASIARAVPALAARAPWLLDADRALVLGVWGLLVLMSVRHRSRAAA